MTNPIIYKLWLNLACKGDIALIDRLIWYFDSEEEIFTLNNISDDKIKDFKKFDIRKLDRSLDKANVIMETCDRKGIKLLGCDDDLYPHELKDVLTPPRFLYAKGNILDLREKLAVFLI